MRVIVVGGTGIIGSQIVKELKQRHDVISVGYSSGDLQCDITTQGSIQNMYQQVKDFDALVVATGSVEFDDFDKMTDEKYQIGLQSKLMGQVNLVLQGQQKINDNGSFTLTSGVLNIDPIKKGTSAAMVGGALEGFVKSCAIELKRGIRINVVSPTVIAESMDKYAPYFRGFKPVKASSAALAYSRSVEGLITGQVLRVGYTLF